ncbi:CRISPR-associated protein Cas5 [bacterium]|nr:CRISPR-associated protein Cas5 [bacterium]
MNRLISVDFHADFGFFRKPDTNDGINLSYNMLHKPALLGILGAIIGLEGYKERGKWPEYYQKLKDMKVGLEPLNHEKGNFQKTVIKYSNTVGYANKGTNYLTEEATLIAPAYRCYLLLKDENEYHQKLYAYLKEGKAEFIPYFGKNEFTAWWESSKHFKEYHFLEGIQTSVKSLNIQSLFIKGELSVNQQKADEGFFFSLDETDSGLDNYFFFERLPAGFNEKLKQYELANFTYSTFPISKNASLENLYYLEQQNCYVQLN